jgi:hypothetical protein
MTTAAFRRSYKIGALSERLRTEIAGDVMGGSRWNTMVCDGFLPLLAAQTGAEKDNIFMQNVWFDWPMGDMPDGLVVLLRRLEIIGAHEWPASHGAGQGGLGWMMAKSLETQSTPLQ